MSLLLLCSFSSKANGDSFLQLDSCKICIKTIRAIQFPILKSKIHYTPIIAWNNYDKTQLGIAFYSKPKLKNIEFELVPLFGLASYNISGIANFKYSFSLKNNKAISVGFKSKRFSYLLFPTVLSFNKVTPFVLLNFTSNKENKHKNTIGFKTNLILLDYLHQGKKNEFYYTNHLFYKFDLNKKKDNFWMQIDVKQASNFALVSGNFNVKLAYATKKKNAFYVRLFVGKYLYSKLELGKILPKAPFSSFQLSGSNSPNLGNSKSRFTQYQKDYNFDYFYFDRNAQDKFFSKQIATISEGGFKTVTNIGNTNEMLLALNLSSDIPIPVPVEPWANFAVIVGLNKPQLYAEFGASVNLFNKFLKIHFPFITTDNILKDNIVERISFSIDLTKLDALRKH